MTALILFEKEKSIAGQFRSRRADKGLDFKLEKQYLASHSVKNPAILECEQSSIVEAMLEGAGLGLSWHPQKGHLYPIPYNFKLPDGKWQKRLQVTVGYRGLIHQVMRAETIKSVQGGVVRKGDPVFRVWTDETGRHIQHEEARNNRGEVTHAYCIAQFANGGHHIETMDATELKACEKAASARNEKGGAVWRGPFRTQMEIKSVIRRSAKFWPQDDAGILRQTMETLDKLEPMDFSTEPEVTITEDDVKNLRTYLVEKGLDSETAQKWLDRVADVNGLSEIRNLPASALEKVKKDLEGYLEVYSRKHNGTA